jgi:hypothetical protein
MFALIVLYMEDVGHVAVAVIVVLCIENAAKQRGGQD